MRTKTESQADKMLDAAARLFGTHRFHEVRMEDIAAEAGVGKGTIYRYFEDKDELYLALLGRSTKQYAERLRAVVGQADGPRRQLQALVDGIIHFFEEQPHLLDLIQRAEVARGPDMPWQKAREQTTELVHEIMAEAQETGAFTVHNPELATIMLLNGLRGIVRYHKRRPPDLSRQIIDGLLQGYATSPCHATK